MTKYCKLRIISNMLDNLVVDCRKLLEVYRYKIDQLEQNINLEFDKPLVDIDKVINLILLQIDNKEKFVKEFHYIISNPCNKFNYIVKYR